MSYFKNSNTGLILLIAILLATNIATITTIFYNNNKIEIANNEGITTNNDAQTSNRLEKRQRKFGSYMSDKLKLNEEQNSKFYSLRAEFHKNAEIVSKEITEKRRLLYIELAKEESDLENLNKIADEIGLLHAELKKLSVNHYISMKEICSPEQQEELYQMFRAMFEKEDRGGNDIHKRKYRNNRNNKNNRNNNKQN